MTASRSIGTPSGFPFRHWILISFIFIGTPLALFLNEKYLELTFARTKHQKRLIEILSPISRNLMNPRESRDFVGRILRRETPSLFKNGLSRKNARRFVHRMKAWFPDTLEFVFLNGHGKPIADLCDIQFPPSLTRPFFHDYCQAVDGDTTSFTASSAAYLPILGPVFDPRESKGLAHHLHLSSYHARRGRLYLSHPFPDGMLIAYVSFPPELEKWCNRFASFDLGKKSAYLKVRFQDDKAGGTQTSNNWAGTDTFLDWAAARLGPRSQTYVALKDHIWTQVFFTPATRTILAIQDVVSPVLRRRFHQNARRTLLLFLILSGLVGILLRCRDRLRIPVAILLMLLLFYVTGIPLALLRIANNGRLAERAASMTTQLFARQEKQLGELDIRLAAATGVWETRIRRVIEAPIPRGKKRTSVIRQRQRWLAANFDPDMFEILDTHGKTVFSGSAKWEEGARKLSALLGAGISKIFAAINETRETTRESAKSQVIGITAELFGYNPDLLLSVFSAHPGTIQEFNLSSVRLKTLLIPIQQRRGKPEMLAVVAWDAGNFESLYLRKALPTYRRRHPDMQLWGYAIKDQYALPGSFPFQRCVEKMFDRVAQDVLPVRQTLVHPGFAFHFTGLKGRQVSRFQLYAVGSDRPIREELERLRNRFLLVNLAILLLSGGVGWVLTRSFLDPVRRLSHGLNALKQRDFTHRIPSLGHDELGNLGRTFNHMIESFEDLATAQIIQKTFFPQSPLEKGPFEIFGAYHPASHLGGDYFDYFPVDERRWFFIIGDVSGHGASAGLVVAMVKALVHFPGNDLLPEPILGLLQHVLSENLGRIKLMSCLAGLLDIETGTLTLANAGHIYPIIIHDSTADFLKVTGSLLGIKASLKKYQTVSTILQPGDRLILLTDGLIEGKDHSGTLIGFEAVLANLPGICQSRPVEDMRLLFEWYRSRAGSGPQEDDITLLELFRSPLQP
jgi:serine phosphatase RsbU (regulator of sigma subunit)